MTRQIIGTLIVGFFLFIWQFLSWNVINLHGAENQYTPNQDKIMEVLSQNLEDGQYFLPNVPNNASAEEHQAAMENGIGKPWARISYYKSMEMNMGMNLFRGLVVDLLTAFLLIWILMQFADLNFTKTLLAALAIGFIAYMTIPYLNSIWMKGNTFGYLIDAIIPWGIIGAFLGWFLNRER